MTTAVIPAEAHSDDFVIEAEFDALRFFQEASAQEIVDLVHCEFGGDYAADEVAHFLTDDFERLKDLFDYLALKPTQYGEPVGFECYVEEEPALKWLKANRPEIHDLLIREELIDAEP